MVSDRMTKTGSGPKGKDATIPRIVADALIHRGELASLELEEARAHGAVTTLTAVFSGILLLLGGVAGILAVAVAIWNRSDRGSILCYIALGFVGAAALLGVLATRRLRAWRPFSGTREQFYRDCACMQDVTGEESE